MPGPGVGIGVGFGGRRGGAPWTIVNGATTDLSDAAQWVRTNISAVTRGVGTGPGGSDVYTLTDSSDAAEAEHRITDTITGLADASARFRVAIKAGSGAPTWLLLRFAGTGIDQRIALGTNGTVGATSGTIDATVADLGDGWWGYDVTVPIKPTVVIYVYMSDANTANTTTARYQGTGTGTLLVSRAALYQ